MECHKAFERCSVVSGPNSMVEMVRAADPDEGSHVRFVNWDIGESRM